MTNTASFQDRRAFGRKATYQHAFAIIAGRAPVRCIVRDLSEGGALLDFGGLITLPGRLQLQWEGSGQIANCDVRHIGEKGVGVQFTCPAGPQIARESFGPKSAPALAEKVAEHAVEAPPLPASASQPGGGASLVQSLRMQRSAAAAIEPEKAAPAPKRFGWLQR